MKQKPKLSNFEVCRGNYNYTLKSYEDADSSISRIHFFMINTFSKMSDDVKLMQAKLSSLKSEIEIMENYKLYKKWYEPKVPNTIKLKKNINELSNLIGFTRMNYDGLEFLCGLYRELCKGQAESYSLGTPFKYENFDKNYGFESFHSNFDIMKIYEEYELISERGMDLVALYM